MDVELADAEIEDPRSPAGLEEDVSGLEIPMHHARAVRVDEAAEDILTDALGELPGERAARGLQALRERLSVEALHEQKELTVVGVIDLEEEGDVLALDAARGLGFPVEPRHQEVVAAGAPHHLDRHDLPGRQVLRFEDLAHAPLPEDAAEPVFPAENSARPHAREGRVFGARWRKRTGGNGHDAATRLPHGGPSAAGGGRARPG